MGEQQQIKKQSFFSKIKSIFSKNKEMDEQKRLDEIPFFSRKELILSRIDKISPSLLNKLYTKNLYRVIFLLLFSFIFMLSGTYLIYEKNNKHNVYISNLKGRVVQYNQTKERIETIKKTVRYKNES